MKAEGRKVGNSSLRRATGRAAKGMSQADAEKRVSDVVTEAKAAADRARRGAAKMAFWMTAYLNVSGR
jgi:hypothetical protein